MKISLVIIALTCYIGVSFVDSLAVMSVDLGSEWMKVGIVSPGVPMEIALNKESKRKTPAVISFRDNIRLFGEDAQTVGMRFPEQTYVYLIDLLGKNIEHPLVKLFQKRFPHYEILENSERGTIWFRHGNDTFYSPEELIAQLLAKAKEYAENGAHQRIKECVLTVPGYFNQVERRALLQSAELAGLKVLQLINDYTAVALNYGIFRSKTFNETSQYVIFYDMGASSTTATLISYQTIKTKERGYVETHPQATVLGVGFDRTLGGLEIQIRLRDYLATKFNEIKKTKSDVFKNSRAMAKLFKEAGRLKNVLSANAEHYAQVENLLDDEDFKLPVKRDDIENLMLDLLQRVGKPVDQALKIAHLTVDVVSQVVLVGAGTRVPKIQEYLRKAVHQELAKNLNTDEAATMGAVYKAADLSTGFKVAKFITKDAVIYPIQVTFERSTEDGIKQVKRTLFGLMNPYPQKKIITFNKHIDDFTFNVNYADLEYLPDNELLHIGSTNLSKYTVSGVAEALEKNLRENIETKGIKAHFAMDDSGLLNLANVELVVEKTILPSEEEGTLSKLGSTFTKLFGGEEEKHQEKYAEETRILENSDQDKDSNQNRSTNESIRRENNETTNNITESEILKEVKPKMFIVKEPLKSSENILTIRNLNKKQLTESADKIKKLDKIETEINRRATALNNLESFVIDVQNKIFEEEYFQASTEEELETIKSSCIQISDWLYEEGSEADADTYEKKLEELHLLTKNLFTRVWEHKERPEALNALHSMLNHSSHFLISAKNLTKTTNPDKDIFTDVEIETLDTLIKDTLEWRDKAVREQNNLKKHDPVKLPVKLLMDKMAALDREVKYLVNKIKSWRPKKVNKPTEDNNNQTEKYDNRVEKENIVSEEKYPKDERASDKQNTKEEIDPSNTGHSKDSHTEL